MDLSHNGGVKGAVALLDLEKGSIKPFSFEKRQILTVNVFFLWLWDSIFNIKVDKLCVTLSQFKKVGSKISIF